MMEQGIIEGAFLPLQEQKFLRLSEVTSQVTLFPTGMYTTAFTIVMNPDLFDSLSEADRQAILDASGERLSRLAGRAWGDADEAGYREAVKAGKNIVRLSEEDPRVVSFYEAIKGMDEEWIESVADRGVDAQAALAMFRELAAAP